VQEAKMLPSHLGPEHIALSHSGEFVLAMVPDAQLDDDAPPASESRAD